MSVGHAKEFNDAARGYDADAALRREKDAAEMDRMQAFQRQLSGVAKDTGEVSQGAGAAREIAEEKAKAEEKERKERTDRAVLLAALGNMEANLADEYGENFADNLWADLFEAGLVEEDDYQRIMAIDDIGERRRAIAAAIQQGIDEGRIRPEDLRGHEWAQDWLSAHRAAAAERDLQAERGLSGELSADEIERDARDEAKYTSIDDNPDERSEFEIATVRTESDNEIDRQAAPALGGIGMGGV